MVRLSSAIDPFNAQDFRDDVLESPCPCRGHFITITASGSRVS
jgi:hypothetical protein